MSSTSKHHKSPDTPPGNEGEALQTPRRSSRFATLALTPTQAPAAKQRVNRHKPRTKDGPRLAETASEDEALDRTPVARGRGRAMPAFIGSEKGSVEESMDDGTEASMDDRTPRASGKSRQISIDDASTLGSPAPPSTEVDDAEAMSVNDGLEATVQPMNKKRTHSKSPMTSTKRPKLDTGSTATSRPVRRAASRQDRSTTSTSRRDKEASARLSKPPNLKSNVEKAPKATDRSKKASSAKSEAPSRPNPNASQSKPCHTEDDMRATKDDVRATRDNIRATKDDVRGTKDDARATKDDVRVTKDDVRATKDNVRRTKHKVHATKVKTEPIEHPLPNPISQSVPEFVEVLSDSSNNGRRGQSLSRSSNQSKPYDSLSRSPSWSSHGQTKPGKSGSRSGFQMVLDHPLGQIMGGKHPSINPVDAQDRLIGILNRLDDILGPPINAQDPPIDILDRLFTILDHPVAVPAHPVAVPAHPVAIPAHLVAVPVHPVTIPAHPVTVLTHPVTALNLLVTALDHIIAILDHLATVAILLSVGEAGNWGRGQRSQKSENAPTSSLSWYKRQNPDVSAFVTGFKAGVHVALARHTWFPTSTEKGSIFGVAYNDAKTTFILWKNNAHNNPHVEEALMALTQVEMPLTLNDCLAKSLSGNCISEIRGTVKGRLKPVVSQLFSLDSNLESAVTDNKTLAEPLLSNPACVTLVVRAFFTSTWMDTPWHIVNASQLTLNSIAFALVVTANLLEELAAGVRTDNSSKEPSIPLTFNIYRPMLNKLEADLAKLEGAHPAQWQEFTSRLAQQFHDCVTSFNPLMPDTKLKIGQSKPFPA
ncbi:hypothetical protein PIIN_10359 [Serendipita indica DSM 11827]|uniref:Uncharacterized protein n=1 Tax=Serendipita indica (strain DSM 11827) TaxID=1109443 RepID=G4TYH3_SERID|nr:hypothetical protein PIIN_10359 [Serendipita indica DSM 11827]